MNHSSNDRSSNDRSNRLRAASAALWELMGDDYGLLPDLPADVVLVRATGDELTLTVPRLLELLVQHHVSVEQAGDIIARIANATWDSRQRAAIEELLDAWWLETLMLEPGEHAYPFTPEVVLGVLAGYDAPMIRWFEPWLAELDGPGALHLASIVLGRPVLATSVDDETADRPAHNTARARSQLARGEVPDWAKEPPPPVAPSGPSWKNHEDQATQFIAWAKSETVINGLAVIGATHLEPEVMSDLLDRLI